MNLAEQKYTITGHGKDGKQHRVQALGKSRALFWQRIIGKQAGVHIKRVLVEKIVQP